MLVIAATSGSAISQSSAIWPTPRIAISSTITSVSGGSVMAAHLVLNWARYTGSPSEFEGAASDALRASPVAAVAAARDD